MIECKKHLTILGFISKVNSDQPFFPQWRWEATAFICVVLASGKNSITHLLDFGTKTVRNQSKEKFMKEFLSLKDVADELGICYENARRMTKRKNKPLPLSPVTHRIFREDLIKWQHLTLDKSHGEQEDKRH